MRLKTTPVLATALLAALLASGCSTLSNVGGALNPAKIWRAGTETLGAECGWVVGEPFDCPPEIGDGRCQLAVQVFSGTNPVSPGWVAVIQEGQLVGKIGDPGKIIRLKGGTFENLHEDGDSLRAYAAGAYRQSWRIENNFDAAECGAKVAIKGPKHLPFFDEWSFLIAAPLTAWQGADENHCPVFDSYFTGAGDDVVRVQGIARQVDFCATKFLDSAPLVAKGFEVTEMVAGDSRVSVPCTAVPCVQSCDVAGLADRASELESLALGLIGDAAHDIEDHRRLSQLATELATLAGTCR